MRLSESWKRIRKGRVSEGMEKVKPGTYTSVLRKFLKSNIHMAKEEYENLENAMNAQKSMLRILSKEKIFNVRIYRRKNVVCMENMDIPSANERIMERFLRVE